MSLWLVAAVVVVGVAVVFCSLVLRVLNYDWGRSLTDSGSHTERRNASFAFAKARMEDDTKTMTEQLFAVFLGVVLIICFWMMMP